MKREGSEEGGIGKAVREGNGVREEWKEMTNNDSGF